MRFFGDDCTSISIGNLAKMVGRYGAESKSTGPAPVFYEPSHKRPIKLASELLGKLARDALVQRPVNHLCRGGGAGS
jgi:hypothetical protein